MFTRSTLRVPLAALLAAALLAMSAPAAARQTVPPPMEAQPAADVAPPTGEIIVQLGEGGELATVAAAEPEVVAEQLATLAGAELDYARPGGVPGMHLLELPAPLPQAEVEVIAARIAAAPGVVYAEPNAILTIQRVPNDEFFAGQMWHFRPVIAGGTPGASNYGADLPAAWDVTTGSNSITVAVIDTGGLLAHPDLAGRTPAGNPGYDMITNTFFANDGGGRDADPSDPGDWVTSADSGTCGIPASNSSWHGSHVAGTIGANADNSVGVAGVDWAARLLHMRALGKCGGTIADIADAVRWAAGVPVGGLPTNPNPARVINMSLGGNGVCGATMQSAINAAVANGAVVVVAAGNANRDLDVAGNDNNPAECNNVITVAATDQGGNRAFYSNYGSTIEISAPGGDFAPELAVLSVGNAGTTVPAANGYSFKVGTSMASPHVAGVVSLMLSVNPALSSAQVAEILQSTATPFPVFSNCNTADCGAGILHAGRAVEEAARRARTVRWSSETQSVNENVGAVTVQVQLSLPSATSISVPFSVGGSAGSGDYTLAAGTLTFPARATTASLTFPIADDSAPEPPETVVLSLGTPAGSPAPAAVGAPGAYTLTILDNDGGAPPLTIALDTAAASEGADAVTLSFDVRREGSGAAGASYTVNALRVSGATIQVAAGTVSVPAGQSTARVTATIPRATLGVARALDVTLSAPTGGTILGAKTTQRVDLAAPRRLFLPLQRR